MVHGLKADHRPYYDDTSAERLAYLEGWQSVAVRAFKGAPTERKLLMAFDLGIREAIAANPHYPVR